MTKYNANFNFNKPTSTLKKILYDQTDLSRV